MSDPRRRRQIKTPSGPRKKDAPNPTSFKMNKPAMGRAEVPKPQPKPDPSQQKQRSDRKGKVDVDVKTVATTVVVADLKGDENSNEDLVQSPSKAWTGHASSNTTQRAAWRLP